MKIDKALEHLAKKIGNNQYSTKFDKECLNTIIDYVADNRKQKMNGQQLFMKLYTHLYTQYVNLYNGDNERPQAKLHRLLEFPMQYHVDILTTAINETKMYFDLGADKYKWRRCEVTEDTVKAWENLELWTKEQVEDNLYKQAQKAVDKYY